MQFTLRAKIISIIIIIIFYDISHCISITDIHSIASQKILKRDFILRTFEYSASVKSLSVRGSSLIC